MTELEKCYGTDGTFVRTSYINAKGIRLRITEYKAYYAAMSRCLNPNTIYFENYGGRGIQFKFTSFNEFWCELGKKPTPQHTVDRIDSDGHYEAGNVRWANKRLQVINSKLVHPILLTHPTGVVIKFETATDVSRVFDISKHSILNLCHGKLEESKGFKAEFVPQLTKE